MGEVRRQLPTREQSSGASPSTMEKPETYGSQIHYTSRIRALGCYHHNTSHNNQTTLLQSEVHGVLHMKTLFVCTGTQDESQKRSL